MRVGDGVPSFVLDSASGLKEDFDITLLAPRVKDSVRQHRLDDVQIRRFAYFPRRWERLADDAIMPQLGKKPILWFQAISLTACMFFAALRESRREGVALVHAHWILPAGLIAMMVARILRTPFIVTARGSDVFALNSRLQRRAKQYVVTSADSLVVTSHSMIERLGAHQAVVQPSGIDLDKWKTAVAPRNPVFGRVLFVGRLARNKGAHVAIRSLSGIPDAHLHVVGDGPERPELESLARSAGVAERVRFIGHADRESLAQEYRHAMCIVIPSLIGEDGAQEGTPNVLGEAAACGVPIVASALSGLAECIEHEVTGLLVPPGDELGLREALQQLLENEQFRNELAHAGQSELAPILSVEKTLQTYRHLYRRALGYHESTARSHADE